MSPEISLDEIADRLRSEASIADRPGQMSSLSELADAVVLHAEYARLHADVHAARGDS